jgi:hypothetical protein
MARYRSGERPWPHPPIDWFIASDSGSLFPLKYTYALAVEQRPGTFTTNQAKDAMRHLEVAFISLKSQTESEQAFQAAVSSIAKGQKGSRRAFGQCAPDSCAVRNWPDRIEAQP